MFLKTALFALLALPAAVCAQQSTIQIGGTTGSSVSVGGTSSTGIKQVQANTGLTGGGNTGSVGLAIDPVLVPLLNTANSFSMPLTVGGYINGLSYQLNGVTIVPSGILGYKGATGYLQMQDGTAVSGDCAQFGAGGVLSDAGSPCGSSTGGNTFATIPGGTNTAATMNVGSGSSLQSTGGPIVATALSGTPSISVTNIAGSGTLTLPGIASTTTRCMHMDNTGAVTVTGADCSTGGSGTVNSATTGQYFYNASSGATASGNSHLDDGATTAGTITAKEPIAVVSSGGSGLGAGEGIAISGSSANDTLWADATAHRWLMNNNNGGAQYVPGVTTAGTSGQCWTVAANGIDMVAATCSTALTMTHAYGSVVPGPGAGTSPTITVTAGASDGSGHIQVTTGTATPGGTVGLFTIAYGGTYATAPKCIVQPYNAAAIALSAAQTVAVEPGTETTAHFVAYIGATAIPASSGPYSYTWICNL